MLLLLLRVRQAETRQEKSQTKALVLIYLLPGLTQKRSDSGVMGPPELRGRLSLGSSVDQRCDLGQGAIYSSVPKVSLPHLYLSAGLLGELNETPPKLRQEVLTPFQTTSWGLHVKLLSFHPSPILVTSLLPGSQGPGPSTPRSSRCSNSH